MNQTLQNALATANAMAFHKSVAPPEDVGQGWFKLQLPIDPIFVHAMNYAKFVQDGYLNIILERRKGRDDPRLFPFGRWHLSMSFIPPMPHKPIRLPTWYELKEARYKFVPKAVNMAIMFPPEELYFNLHPTCLHLLEIPVGMAINPSENGGI